MRAYVRCVPALGSTREGEEEEEKNSMSAFYIETENRENDDNE